MKPTLADTVRLPVQSDVEQRLLHFLYRYNRPVEPKELYNPIAEDLGLSQQQRSARYRISGEVAWPTLLRQARRRLVDIGYIDKNSQRGFWVLTPEGRERARLADVPLTHLL